MISALTPLAPWDAAALDALGARPDRVTSDSRRVLPGDLFLAFRGEYADGRNYIADAIARGAVAVAWDPADGFEWQPGWTVPNLPVPDLRARAGVVASFLLGRPSEALTVIGVTGTNGKTSITTWLAQAFTLLGQKAALIGTVGNGFFGALSDATHTTPDPVTVQRTLADFRRQGAHVVAMEVSSHGLDQFRVNGVTFGTAVFTNLTRDHLDYHGSMAAYGATKERLFHWQGLQHAVINVDDQFGRELASRCTAGQVITYGLEHGDVRPMAVHASLEGLAMELATPWGHGRIESAFLGRFNASNLLACLAVLCVNGVPLAQACRVLGQIQPARGRMQRVGGTREPLVVIDYAHTPDALEKALSTLADIKPAGGRLFAVFGCGGDRDRGKRPLMGDIAERFADVTVVTSDNPRTESPQAIIDDILAGMRQPTHVEPDRRAAIRWAVAQARVGDVVLVAGKGHEDYQDIQGVKHSFSDVREAEAALCAWGQRPC